MKFLLFILVILGLIVLFPEAWENIEAMLNTLRGN